MNLLPIFDETSQPARWNDFLLPGQYGVFHSKAATRDRVTADGRRHLSNSDQVPVFDSLAEARAYAHRKVAEIPWMACEIYDRRGEYKEATEIIYHPAYTPPNETEKFRRCVQWGLVLTALSVVAIGAEWWSHWQLVFGIMLGGKLLVMGVALANYGYWNLRDPRHSGL